MSIGVMYVSHSTTRESANFNSVPFHNASITWERESASTMSFRSPSKFSEGDRVRYKSVDGEDFGGQIYKIKKSINGDYSYDCISYLRLYHDKVTCSFKNKTSSQIMKKVLALSKNDFSTAGIKNTTAINTSLKWENTSIWDIACQLCWLEHQSGYEVRCNVNSDGTLEFGPAPTQQNGYSFTNARSYDEEYDSSDLITQYTITNNNEVLATAVADSALIAKWGYVGEVEECQTQQETSTSATTSGNDTVTIKAGTDKSVAGILKGIIKAGMTDTQKAKAIFDWFRHNHHYEFYSCSKYGAVNSIKKRRGNCADSARAFGYMCNAVNLSVRYCHATRGCGHFWTEVRLNGKWVTVDTGRGPSGGSSDTWGSHWSGAGGASARSPTNKWTFC